MFPGCEHDHIEPSPVLVVSDKDMLTTNKPWRNRIHLWELIIVKWGCCLCPSSAWQPDDWEYQLMILLLAACLHQLQVSNNVTEHLCIYCKFIIESIWFLCHKLFKCCISYISCVRSRADDTDATAMSANVLMLKLIDSDDLSLLVTSLSCKGPKHSIEFWRTLEVSYTWWCLGYASNTSSIETFFQGLEQHFTYLHTDQACIRVTDAQHLLHCLCATPWRFPLQPCERRQTFSWLRCFLIQMRWQAGCWCPIPMPQNWCNHQDRGLTQMRLEAHQFKHRMPYYALMEFAIGLASVMPGTSRWN